MSKLIYDKILPVFIETTLQFMFKKYLFFFSVQKIKQKKKYLRTSKFEAI